MGKGSWVVATTTMTGRRGPSAAVARTKGGSEPNFQIAPLALN